MGLTKQYLRYAPSAVFGVVGTHKSPVLFFNLKGGGETRFCATGACENVIVWDLRKGEKVLVLQGDKHEVTALTKNPNHSCLAVGYEDGTVKVFDVITGEVTVTFSGHKKAVTALCYDQEGVRLVSGSKDTDVIVWDIVSECGLYRLRGHKGMVTQACFVNSKNYLITSSKDTFVKFWDLDTQHCFKTLVGHRSEVWGFVLTKGDARLITGSGDSELRVWNLVHQEDGASLEPPPSKKLSLNDEDTEEGDESSPLTCVKVGSIMRQGRQRVVNMMLDSTGQILVCNGPDVNLEVFRIHSREELTRKLHKKEKKAKKRARESGEDAESVVLKLEDEIEKISIVKTSSKLRSFDLCLDTSSNILAISSLLSNNTVELHGINISEKKPAQTDLFKLTLPGHRTDVRTLSFSSDNTAVLSGSGEAVKIWNRASQQCIRTMPCEYALCSLFAPGDRHAIVGTKSGKIQIYDIAAGSVLESIDAHSGAVWSLSMAPDKRGIVSGSADKSVKFWDFELITDPQFSATVKRLSLVHKRTLQMDEDVLCVKFSPDQRLIAVSLLDNTVKVFFVDTLKFFLSLYGHKLPVLCMDISSDSTLLVTGSADRNVKIWGLDFGDCHKSIFAHDDSVMCLQFIAKTHLFFSGGKDKKLKQWDADIFEHIVTLEGHHAEVWCLAVSPLGNHVVTGSHDKSLRIWEKTQEPLVLEEEREMAREKQFEAENIGAEPVVAGETSGELGLAGKQTLETVKAAERIMEALELYKEETTKQSEHEAECKAAGKQVTATALHPLLMAYGLTSPSQYVLQVIRKVKSSELEESLLVLPFTYVTQLLSLLNTFIDNNWETELCCRCLLFLLKIHQGQITSNQILLPVLDNLRQGTATQVNKIRDTIGFNMAGLKFLQQQVQEKEEVTFFSDATDRFKLKNKKSKKRAILALKT